MRWGDGAGGVDEAVFAGGVTRLFLGAAAQAPGVILRAAKENGSPVSLNRRRNGIEAGSDDVNPVCKESKNSAS